MRSWLSAATHRFRRSHGELSPQSRTLIWATLAGLLVGVFAIGQPLEDVLRTARNGLHAHNASGDIVVVGIDEKSLQELGTWPWPRSYHARLIDRARKLGARKIVFDIQFTASSKIEEDEAFAAALARNPGVVTLAAWQTAKADVNGGIGVPIPSLRQHADLASIDVYYDYRGTVWRLDYSDEIAGKSYPTPAAVLANRSGRSTGSFLVDYSTKLQSLPKVSASDLVLPGKSLPNLHDKDLIVGLTAKQLGDTYYVPGIGRTPGVYLHALGGETLKARDPVDLGWLGPLIFAFLAASLMIRSRQIRRVVALASATAFVLLALPAWAESGAISADVVPALFLLLVVATRGAWSTYRTAYRVRGTLNVVTGLPNFEALRQTGAKAAQVLIAARIGNYATIASTLTVEAERSLVEQLARRLTVGASNRVLYQGDEGIFAWFTEHASLSSVGEQMEALNSFFRNSLEVAGEPIDLTISFGADADLGRSLSNRIGSALLAAEEAAAEGIKWKIHDRAMLEEATWKLSLLGQLDRAIEGGDLWVAYQPKLDLITRNICGAEALVRWTHPEKGPIQPLDFILAAEQSDRIERLTRFVLERAIASTERIARSTPDFNIAVNLSARLIDDPTFSAYVLELLAKHGLSPANLTLEVTETAAITSGCANLDTLRTLRQAGVQVAIDDYGTGLSTLEYLRKIPATEIKIDQSFVQGIMRSPADRLMVHSTIELVHSLGKRVVAEGVEDSATLEALAHMGCDQAQGFLIGRPVPIDALLDLMARRPEKLVSNAR